MSWPTVPMGELALVTNGKTPSKSEKRYSGHPVLKVRDVDEIGQFRGVGDSFVDESLAMKFQSKWVRSGDTLILNAAHNADYVGSKTFFAPEAASGLLATGEWLIVRPKPEALDQGFAHHWLTSASTKRSLKDLVKGIHLYPKDVARLQIPLPPLPEQRRIAAILDQADALRRLRRQSLSRLSDLGQAIFYEMFANSRPSDWPLVTIADVINVERGGIRTGPFGSQLLHSEFVEQGIAVLGIDNAVSNEFRWAKERHITPEKYASLRRYKVFPGDVLITIMGTCGRVAIVPDDVREAINTKHLCCITLDQNQCLPDYLHAYFLYHPIARHYLGVRSKGAIMDGLNMGIIKELPLLLPPMDKQREFVCSVGNLKAQVLNASDAMASANSLFASLQHRAFRGEL